MKFSDIPGLQKTKALLSNAINNKHIPHAQLFAGAPGCLALPMALAWSTYLHCTRRTDDACGTCPACVKSLKYIHPDTHFAFPAPSPKSGEEEKLRAENLKAWRNFLLEQPFDMPDDWTTFLGSEDKQLNISREDSRQIIRALALKPFESAYKVMIIWCPERMHPSAANALLKILEEPPAHTYFILVSYAADALLPTILSRTQHVHIPLLSADELKAFLLQKHPETNPDEVVRLADGNLNLALRLLEQDAENPHQMLATWLRSCYKKDFSRLVQMADDFHNQDRLSQHLFIRYALTIMRESLIAVSGAGTLHRIGSRELEFVNNFSGILPVPAFEKAVHLLNQADYYLERNGSAKMIFMSLSVQLADIMQNPGHA
ncbi:MAG: DNA polymerase III subunit delta [Cyclobacteriaceae bacterium]|nr:MAG: DNA polymerase III subunit delta [Cyclobacteriaceae bacterium]